MGIEVIGTQGYQIPVEPVTVAGTASAPVQTATANAIQPVAGKNSSSSEGQVKSESGEQPSAEEIKSAINQANKRATSPSSSQTTTNCRLVSKASSIM